MTLYQLLSQELVGLSKTFEGTIILFFHGKKIQEQQIPEIVQKGATFSLGHLVDLFMIFVYMCKASLFGRICLIQR